MKASAELDAADPLNQLRLQFVLPTDKIYLDGNSLGPLSRNVREHLTLVINEQWAEDLIAGWNTHNWIDLPLKVGNQLAPILGGPSGRGIVLRQPLNQLIQMPGGRTRTQGTQKKDSDRSPSFPDGQLHRSRSSASF